MDYVYQLIDLIKRWTSYFGFGSESDCDNVFYKLLLDKNYDEAIKLAEQNRHLDIDLVYKYKWRMSGITVQSINSVLGMVQDKLWALNECVNTVPISYEACRTLIDFGLNMANIDLLKELGRVSDDKDQSSGKIRKFAEKKRSKRRQVDDTSDDDREEAVNFNCLNEQQSELCRFRQDLIRHEHSLSAYVEILGDSRSAHQQFDHVFYEEFRRKCPLEACLDFAHEGDANAVEILLDFYPEHLQHHILPILSNIPETISPHHYKNLLSRLTDANSSKKSRERVDLEDDWSFKINTLSPLSKFIHTATQTCERNFYQNNTHLKKYANNLDDKTISSWFVERALEMESMTLLLKASIQLLFIGTNLKFTGLDKAHQDLIEFDRIIYDCCSETNIYLSFSDFEKMTEMNRILLMTGDSVKGCKDRFRFHVLPYIHRHNAKLSVAEKSKLLRDYFCQLAYTREQVCKLIYNDLLDQIESDNFVSEWTKDMDDTIDEIGQEIVAIERKRQAEQLSTVANQTMALGDLNGCYEACQLIVKNQHRDCWAICCQLGMHKKFNNHEAKYKLLAFALAHCEDPDGKVSSKMLDYVIELRKRDEKIQLEYIESNL